MRQKLLEKIFRKKSDKEFEQLALDVFSYQMKYNKIYNQYCTLIKRTEPKSLKEIPFLPISFFKTQKIQTQEQYQQIFTSSGTTGLNTSKHRVYDLSVYEQAFTSCFEEFYGSSKDFLILALLPSYLERTGSSLIYMCDKMIKQSKYEESSFFLNEYDKLFSILKKHANSDTKILLIGISYALIDFSSKYKFDKMENLTVMETGGTKGMDREYTKTELHDILKQNFKLNTIHSEYGMTELLSQAYSKGEEIYESSESMRVICSNVNDSLSPIENGKTGLLNIIDLANIDSCAFIATEDIGIKLDSKRFKILGRLDNSDIRGCNLLTIN